MCTHNLCFEQKYENSKKILPQIVNLITAAKKWLYLAWACFRNELKAALP